ncbi:Argininosuccinate lyase [Emticicia aquatica]|uniref:Argininosuccinate lyase n=1 Tax=Emticicia aquatica TaxID=1681835 RepID=A0ABM9AV55_9BACT|nr:argininosuccinate lyase [Emticicia aquatica]CAH0997836.1 Argininosuccinate lyase [Emticicia aquatica]
MKLWQKESNKTSEKEVALREAALRIEQFTVGGDREMDMYLAEFDVLGSMAHAIMLESIGLLETNELGHILNECRKIYNDIINGKFFIEKNIEDVHSQVEWLLTQALGDAGKKIHSGRSRNDQVLVDLKLFMRHQVRQVVNQTETLFHKLIELSNKHKNDLLPGYTHLQIAMPSSFGLWFGAYAESLVDDTVVMQAAYKVVNKNPLGSGAGYGSSFPLNRTLTTKLLGFDDLNYNVVYAQMTRGKTEYVVLSGLTSLATTLSRMAMDICLYNSQNFSFLTLPDAFTTGSSIMPHKKNPDVAELLRAKTNRLKGLPTELAFITSNLPSGYHRDMQILKEILMPAFDQILECLDIAHFMLSNIEVKTNLLDDKKYDPIFSVERVNELVMQGLPFRDAYLQVKDEIFGGNYEASRELNHTLEGSIGNLCNDEITKMMNKTINNFDFNTVDEALEKLLSWKVE